MDIRLTRARLMFFWFTARSIGCESFFFQYIFQIYFRSVLSSKTAVSISCNWPYTVSESRPFLAFYTSIDAASHEQPLFYWQCRRIMHYARAICTKTLKNHDFWLILSRPKPSKRFEISWWFWQNHQEISTCFWIQGIVISIDRLEPKPSKCPTLLCSISAVSKK